MKAILGAALFLVLSALSALAQVYPGCISPPLAFNNTWYIDPVNGRTMTAMTAAGIPVTVPLTAGSQGGSPATTAARVFLPSPWDKSVYVGFFDANTDNQVPFIDPNQPTAGIYKIQPDSILAFP